MAERALLVVGWRLASVAKEAEFLGLPREALLELVRSDGLAVRSERVVYEAVMGWVRHDVGSRKAWLGEMLGAVRMALLRTPYLISSVSADPLVMESLEALRMVVEAIRYSQLRGAERAAAESDGRLRKRKHALGGELVVAGGKDTGGSRLKSAEMYDGSTGEWRALPEMSVARDGCAAVSIEGSVYVVGGFDGHSYLKSAEMYDGSTREWRALPEMSVARWKCAAVCLEGSVYVVGGRDGTTFHASAECYDLVANEWRTLPSMSTARWFCAAAAAELGHG